MPTTAFHRETTGELAAKYCPLEQGAFKDYIRERLVQRDIGSYLSVRNTSTWSERIQIEKMLKMLQCQREGNEPPTSRPRRMSSLSCVICVRMVRSASACGSEI